MNTITMSYSDLIEMRAYQKGMKEAEEKANLKAKEAEEKANLKTVNSVKNMIKLNMTDEIILQCIELSLEEITEIRNGNLN